MRRAYSHQGMRPEPARSGCAPCGPGRLRIPRSRSTSMAMFVLCRCPGSRGRRAPRSPGAGTAPRPVAARRSDLSPVRLIPPALADVIKSAGNRVPLSTPIKAARDAHETIGDICRPGRRLARRSTPAYQPKARHSRDRHLARNPSRATSRAKARPDAPLPSGERMDGLELGVEIAA